MIHLYLEQHKMHKVKGRYLRSQFVSNRGGSVSGRVRQLEHHGLHVSGKARNHRQHEIDGVKTRTPRG